MRSMKANCAHSTRACANCWAATPFRYVAELKMDGLSMAARYRDGLFAAGHYARRWHDRRRCDGECAHHPLAAAAASDATEPFEVRGEMVMNRKAFERLNASAKSAV